MRLLILVLALAAFLVPLRAGEMEIRSAQNTIASQIEAFIAGDDATAYSFAAPNIKRLFPTIESFMGMVKGGYRPVYSPRNYSFGKARQISPTSIIQQVLLVGPDGRNYEAVYSLELQPDGRFRITGVSLHQSSDLST